MLTEICQYLRNWFAKDMYIGEFVIADGVLTTADGGVLPLLDNQYYRIVGSILNDGVHKFGDAKDTLADEAFNGAVWSMAVPVDFLALDKEITDWCKAYAEAINSPYASESFGGYSYSFRSGNSTGGANIGATGQNQFAARLAPWRKI